MVYWPWVAWSPVTFCSGFWVSRMYFMNLPLSRDTIDLYRTFTKEYRNNALCQKKKAGISPAFLVPASQNPEYTQDIDKQVDEIKI